MKPSLIFRIGWREFWREWRAFFLIIFALVVGTTALFGVLSSIGLMRTVLSTQSREIMGGDIQINTDYASPPEVLKFLDQAQSADTLQFTQLQETNSVVYTTEKVDPINLLTEVKVIEPVYPLYGTFLVGTGEKAPVLSAQQVLVEPAVLARLHVQKGADLRIGSAVFQIQDTVANEPDRVLSFSVLGPRIFLSPEGFQRTGLLTTGTRMQYSIDVKVFDPQKIPGVTQQLKTFFSDTAGRIRTAENGPPQLERVLTNLQYFFVSVALVTVFLAGIGIAITMTGYVQRKKRTLAIWKCLGMVQSEALSLFLFQAFLAGIFGGIVGGLLGSVFPLLLNPLLANFLPFSFTLSFSWALLGTAMFFGLAMVLISTALPLLGTRQITPLALLRPFSTAESTNFQWRETGIFGGILMLLSGLLIFFFLRNIFWSAVVLGALVGAIFFLAILFQLFFRWWEGLRRHLSSFFLRTLFALFRRARWRRIFLLIALTLSMGMILLVLFLRDNLSADLGQIQSTENGTNVVMIDVQKDQVPELTPLLPEKVTLYPRISARIFAINGKEIDRTDRNLPAEMTREFNLTYRDELIAGEKIAAGKLWVKDSAAAEVSVDTTTAENFGLTLGSTITFDIQGVRRDFQVTSLRIVERNFSQPFFFFLMPRKALEDAPQVLFGFLHISPTEISALQNRIGLKFPNILVLDVGQIVATVERINTQVANVLLFFGGFIFLAGLLLLLGMVQSTAQERQRDIVLMKVLGASEHFLRNLTLLEFSWYAGISGLFGLLIAALGAFWLNHQLFQINGLSAGSTVWIVLLILMCSIVLIGTLRMQILLRKSPRELLQEGG